MGGLKIVPFHKPCRILYGILQSSFRAKAFVCEELLEVSKIAKSMQYDLTIIFMGLSETSSIFVKRRLVLKIKKRLELHKKRFCQKETA